MSAYNEKTWDEASNEVGFTFSTTITINKPKEQTPPPVYNPQYPDNNNTTNSIDLLASEETYSSDNLIASTDKYFGINFNSYNIENAVNYLNNNSLEKSSGRCAYFVRQALEAGGINTNPHPISAKDYGSYLIEWGFSTVSRTNYIPIKGDISVIQPYSGGSPHGHIQMYNGSIWLSDFKQKIDFWPGGGYRLKQPDYQIYRWNNKP